MIVTKKRFAAQQRVAHNTISSWIKRGHLSGAALTADGRINVEEAERQLRGRIDLARSIGRRLSAQRPVDVLQPASPAPRSQPEFVDVNRRLQQPLREVLGELLMLAAGWVIEGLVPAIGDDHAAEIAACWRAFRHSLEEHLGQPFPPCYAPASEFSRHFELAIDEEILVPIRDWAVNDLSDAMGCDRAVVVEAWRTFWHALETRYVPPGSVDHDPGPRIQGIVVKPDLIRREPSIGLGPEDDLVPYFGVETHPLQPGQRVVFNIVRDHEWEWDGGFCAVNVSVLGAG